MSVRETRSGSVSKSTQGEALQLSEREPKAAWTQPIYVNATVRAASVKTYRAQDDATPASSGIPDVPCAPSGPGRDKHIPARVT